MRLPLAVFLFVLAGGCNRCGSKPANSNGTSTSPSDATTMVDCGADRSSNTSMQITRPASGGFALPRDCVMAQYKQCSAARMEHENPDNKERYTAIEIASGAKGCEVHWFVTESNKPGLHGPGTICHHLERVHRVVPGKEDSPSNASEDRLLLGECGDGQRRLF